LRQLPKAEKHGRFISLPIMRQFWRIGSSCLVPSG
jgi:hypothetical protein